EHADLHPAAPRPHEDAERGGRLALAVPRVEHHQGSALLDRHEQTLAGRPTATHGGNRAWGRGLRVARQGRRAVDCSSLSLRITSRWSWSWASTNSAHCLKLRRPSSGCWPSRVQSTVSESRSAVFVRHSR